MIDPQQLREARRRELEGTHTVDDRAVVTLALDRYLTVLEQGEKLEWCEVHGAPKWSRRLQRCLRSNGLQPCRYLSSFRFPAALLEGDPE